MSVTQIVRDCLRDAKVRWLVLLGVVGLTAGAGLLTAASALAANGTEPGNLVLSPASGPISSTPTWSTTDGCPSGVQGSAVVDEFKSDGSLFSRISTVASPVTSKFGGTLDGSVAGLISFAHLPVGGSLEWAVACWSGPGGTGSSFKYVQSTFVTLSSATTYSTSSVAPSGTPSASPTSSPSSSPTATPSGTPSSTPSSSPTDTPSSSPTATGTPTATPTPTNSILPSGAPATGAGGASLPGDGKNVLIALGAMALTGSAAAMVVAFRRARGLPGRHGPGDTNQGGSS